jgi:putative ABC transport system substrate-binding protein
MAVVAAGLFRPLFAEAQPITTRPFRVIGFLQEKGLAESTGAPMSFGVLTPQQTMNLVEGLRSAGYGGKEVRIVPSVGDGSVFGDQTLDGKARSLVQLQAEVIVSVGTPATLAAVRATRTIPIFAIGVSDLVALGLAQSVRRPGGNVTGLTIAGSALLAKGLQFLVEAVPTARRVAVLWNPSNPGAATAIGELHAVARSLRVVLVTAIVRQPTELDEALKSVTPTHPNALLVVNDPMFVAQPFEVLRYADTLHLATMFQSNEWVRWGGLMAYEPDFDEMQRRAGAVVARLLEGTSPAVVPIEESTRFHLVVNLKTAKTLGLTIPRGLLLRADQVFE